MERILRSVIQLGGQPSTDDAYQNWVRLREYALDFPGDEDREIYDYLVTFYNDMSAPPDYGIVQEFFEKKDKIEVVARLEEIKKSVCYTHTNFLSIVRSEHEQQLTKNFIIALRDASTIAEHGKNLDKPIDGKKILRGVDDAINYISGKLPDFTRVEFGEKVEGVINDDADEVVDEYDVGSKLNKMSGRNLFGLEPVDVACGGHRMGELWIHCAYAAELKCVPGDATIYDHKTQRRWSMKDMFESGKLPRVTAIYKEGAEPKLVEAEASHLVQNGIRPVYEMTLESGRRVAATLNHPFFTINGWKKFEEISEGDWIGVPKQTRISNPTSQYSDSEVKAIGYLLGDGYVGDKSSPSFTALNDVIRSDFMTCLSDMGMIHGPFDGQTANFREVFQANRVPSVRMSKSRGNGNFSATSPIQSLIDSLSMNGKVAATKRIPDEFFGLSNDQICLLLGSLWSTDGSFHSGMHPQNNRVKPFTIRNDIKYYSTSRGLCSDVQSLLLRIGVQSTVTQVIIEYLGEPYQYWTTRIIGNQSKIRFCEQVQVIGKEKYHSNALQFMVKISDRNHPSSLIKSGDIVSLKGRKCYASLVKHRETCKEFVLERFASKDKEIKEYLDGDVRWERVTKKEYRGDEMTYDLSVPEHHSFVVDDVISHNTSLALNYLYNNTYIYGKNIFYAILEMQYRRLRLQLYVIHSSNGKFVTEWYYEDKKRGLPPEKRYTGLDYRQVRDFELDEISRKRLALVAQDFKVTRKGTPFVWRPSEPGGVTMDAIRRKAEMFHNKYGCDGIVIDYLGLVQPRTRLQNTVDIANSVVQDARMLASNFARGRSIPLLGLFQLNRQGKMRADKADGRYDTAAIAYANQIEKDADVITYTYLNDMLRKEGKFYLGCLKNREGEVFDRMIGKILWKSKRMRAIRPGLLDPNVDLVKTANEVTLTGADMLYG